MGAGKGKRVAHDVTMPRQGWTMETGSIVEWLKRPGEFVRQGEQLLIIQSDKAANEIEALESGYLDIPPDSPAIGVEVPIGTVLGALLTEAEALARGLPIVLADAHAPKAAPRATAPKLVPSVTEAGLVAASAMTRLPGAERDDVSLYREMVRIRKVEEALARSHQQGLVHGAHGHALAKGVTARELAAELFGRETGCAGGRGGSMHLFKPEVGLMGTSGIVGPCILLATGAGYTSSLLRDGRVSVGHLRLRKQPIRNGGSLRDGLEAAGCRPQGGRLRYARGRGGRERCSCRLGSCPGCGRACARRTRAYTDRSQDLSYACSFRRHAGCRIPVG
ncbi:MAG: hypothetical protein EBT00_08195 [Proteobacteria bacterium]|nr:hypothetical protein [Pseudomonadota bacterium]